MKRTKGKVGIKEQNNPWLIIFRVLFFVLCLVPVIVISLVLGLLISLTVFFFTTMGMLTSFCKGYKWKSS